MKIVARYIHKWLTAKISGKAVYGTPPPYAMLQPVLGRPTGKTAMLSRHQYACLGVSIACLWGSTAARAEQKLDLALVLAVDVSSSMASDEQELQRLGFVRAFQSPTVHKAIAKGFFGRIAVVYVEWAGADDQVILVPWTVIDGPDAARSFATMLAHKPMRRAGMTSLSGVISFSMRLFADLKDEPERRVIDISGDGPNNDGPKVTYMRDHATSKGLTINGLPIMIKGRVSNWDLVDLDAYYKDCVIGGVGSFMIPVHHTEQFATVIQTKILREIAGTSGGASLVV